MVGIVGTDYRPLDNAYQIKEALHELTEVINRTDNPIEKALIAVLMLVYIQPFGDGNKRTSRIVGNALLLTNDYGPLSYRSVDEVEYKKGVILKIDFGNGTRALFCCFSVLFCKMKSVSKSSKSLIPLPSF